MTGDHQQSTVALFTGRPIPGSISERLRAMAGVLRLRAAGLYAFGRGLRGAQWGRSGASDPFGRLLLRSVSGTS